jgi:hypothetical protein
MCLAYSLVFITQKKSCLNCIREIINTQLKAETDKHLQSLRSVKHNILQTIYQN